MTGRIKSAFEAVRADEKLKENTKTYVTRQICKLSLRQKKLHHRFAVFAVCLALLLFIGGGYYLYFVPTSVISIDINPSFELNINRFNKVVGIKGYNEDGETLASALDISFMNYDQAVDEILNNQEIKELLAKDEILTITAVSDQGEAENMLSVIQNCVSGNKNIYCYSANPDKVAKAHEIGLSYGKYKAFLELSELREDVTPEQIKDMSMKEIRDMIEEISKDSQDNSNESGNGRMGNGYGHGQQNGKNG